MPSVLVTGANRGIGLGLVKELLKDPSVTIVIATVRNVETATVMILPLVSLFMQCEDT